MTSQRGVPGAGCGDVIDGAKAVMKYLELDNCYIGIENNKQDAISNFNSLLKEHANILTDNYIL